MRTLKIMSRNLNEIVWAWIRLQEIVCCHSICEFLHILYSSYSPWYSSWCVMKEKRRINGYVVFEPFYPHLPSIPFQQQAFWQILINDVTTGIHLPPPLQLIGPICRYFRRAFTIYYFFSRGTGRVHRTDRVRVFVLWSQSNPFIFSIG